MVRYSLAFLCLTLAGCAGQPYDTSELVHPSSRCMIAPAPLSKLKEGDDLVQAYAVAAGAYRRETSKLKCVQRWARTVTAKN